MDSGLIKKEIRTMYYDFFEVNEFNGTKGKLRARAVSNGSITTERLTTWMMQTSGMSKGEAKGFLAVLTDSLVHFLKLGYHVEVGELGYFWASVTSKLVDRENEIRGESVKFSKLNFKPTRKVRKELENTETKLIDRNHRRRRVDVVPLEKRIERLKDFIGKNGCISRTDYCRITLLGRETAIKELNSFIEEGWLRRYGHSRNAVYLLK